METKALYVTSTLIEQLCGTKNATSGEFNRRLAKLLDVDLEEGSRRGKFYCLDLKVGGSRFFDPDSTNIKTLRRSLDAQARRTGRVFVVACVTEGYQVLRKE